MCTSPHVCNHLVDLSTGESFWKFEEKAFDASGHRKKVIIGATVDVDGASCRILDSCQVPCQNCIECRLNYSKSWALRLMAEASEHEQAQFITLTYTDETIPLQEVYHPVDRVKEVESVLRLEDLQKFLKRLRRYIEYHYHKQIRFFACGEYGDQTDRAHWHLLLFGHKFEPDQLWTKHDGISCWRSFELEDIWKLTKDGKTITEGICTIGDFNYQTAAYVSRYMLKKQKGEGKKDYEQYVLNAEGQDNYKDFLKPAPMIRMSTRPGIGSEFFDKYHVKIYEYDSLVFPATATSKAVSATPPRYFDNKYDKINSTKLQQIKEIRRGIAERSTARRDSIIDLTPEDSLFQRAENVILRVKQLKRSI